MPFAHIWQLLSILCERRDDSRQPKKVENSAANRRQHRQRRRRTSGTRIHIFHGVCTCTNTNTQLCAVMRPRKETCQCDNGLATELANINRKRIELCSSFSLCMPYAWSVLHSFRYGIWLTQWWGKQRCHWCAAKSFFAFFFLFSSFSRLSSSTSYCCSAPSSSSSSTVRVFAAGALPSAFVIVSTV